MKLFFRGAMLFAAAALCCGCGGARDAGRSWRYMDTGMGTVIEAVLYAPEDAASRFFDDSMALLGQLEREELSWRLETSEVFRINASAGSEEGCAISAEMASVLESCLELYGRSEGAFDVTLGALTRLWEIDSWAAGGGTGEFQPPSQEAISRAMRVCGSGQIRMETAQGETRVFLPEGMRLDLGAVGKGIAQSRLGRRLAEDAEITGAVISLGGSILTYGSKADHSPWRVGITDPFDPSAQVGTLSLEGQWCVSTSGDYERYVEAGGIRYHHILDPSTGRPAVGRVRGVTILTKDGLPGDGLSTACFLLGPEAGMALAAAYGAEALFLLSDGRIVLSEGMEAYFTRSPDRLPIPD